MYTSLDIRLQIENRLRAEIEQAKEALNTTTGEQRECAKQRYAHALKEFTGFLLTGRMPSASERLQQVEPGSTHAKRSA